MAGVPAGLESSSDSDGELFYCGEDPQLFLKKYEKDISFKNEYSRPVSNSTTNDVKLSNGHANKETKSENGFQSPEVRVPKNTQQPKTKVISKAIYDDLRLAILQHNLELTQEIFENGIPVDAILKSGWTSLMYACSLGDVNIVKYLLLGGADPNYHKDLFTPLMSVCASKQDEQYNLLKCVELLLEHGARVNVWDRHHMTPLMFASRENHIEIVSQLVKKNSELDRQDNKGWTALCWAASGGNGQLAKLLIEAGANVSLVTSSGQTATEIALGEGYEELGQILQKAEKTKSRLFSEQDLKVLNFQKTKNPFSEFEAVERKTKIFNSRGEIELFLTGISLSNWSKLFEYHEINFKDFLLLTDEELISMGVDKIGVRNKIQEAIKAVHLQRWERSSLPNIKEQKYISCPDAVAVMSNIGTHVQYMHSTIRYLRRQLQQKPRILELGQEQANVKRLLNEASLALSVCNNMKEELRFFERHLNKVQDNIELNPGDMIVETRNRRSNNTLFITIMGTTLVAFYFGWQKPEYFRKLVLLAQPWQTCAS